jgi:beta-N-acetylhexosaminidase
MSSVGLRTWWVTVVTTAFLAAGQLALPGVSASQAGSPGYGHPPVVGKKVTTSTLTSAQQAGQRIIYSYAGLTPPADLIQRLRSGEAAGVIFFGDNISSESQIGTVVTQLRQAAAQSPVKAPLLLMTDQEGGEVRRLPGAPMDSEKTIGAASDATTLAAQAGTGAGQNLAGVGMNLNLAPVLDVYRTPGDFDDQFQRSYSTNPTTAGTLGKTFITSQQGIGPAATAKHFPGLGSATATQNTDTGPVTLTVPLATLRSVDEAPYVPAIAAGVKLVMVSWATYPALDASHPAGLSSAVVQNELRGRLGFQGVTVTDALEAGALQAFGTNAQRAVLAAQAGMDLILCSDRDPAQGDQVDTALADALDSGTLNRSTFTVAMNRVTALRNSLH